jgi:transcriptional regulator with XRE-family HTH domain
MTVNEAARELRKNSGQSQPAFSTYAGLSLRALQKYEQEQTPEPRALVRLMALALDGGFSVLYRVFALELLNQLAAPGWTVEFDLHKGDTTVRRGPSHTFRIFRPAWPDGEIRWRKAEGK